LFFLAPLFFGTPLENRPMIARPALTRFLLLLTALLPLAALAATATVPRGPAPLADVDYVVIEAACRTPPSRARSR
jgi:hypothetical protein